jgi:hypothetical protein
MMRRMRTRLPTYLSTGLGALVDIANTPWDYAGEEAEQRRIMPQVPMPPNSAQLVVNRDFGKFEQRADGFF